MNGDRHDAKQALDRTIEKLRQFRHEEGEIGVMKVAEFRTRAFSIHDYVMMMSNPDPVDPAAGAGGGAKTKCPHCNNDITISVTK
jgi:hypothetical protein